VHVIDIRPGFVDTPMTRGLPLPGMLVVQPDTVARRIVAGIDRRADVLYAPAYWTLIMFVVRTIPGFVFKRIRL
jgi:short-subunit dehydrogenase